MMPDMKVGIIGVGLMGHGIARNIQRAGWPLALLEHSGNQPTVDLEKAGAEKHATPEDLARQSDVIILCVTGATQVEEVLTARQGVLSGLREGTVIVDCSTSLPQTTRKLAALVENAGGRFIDAPMTRTPKEAAEGRLNLIVGGKAEDIEYVLPILQSFAENITHAGALGTGHAMKLLHNFVSLGFSAVLAEAAAAANAAGVDPAVFQGILANGGGASTVLDRMTPYILEKDSTAFQFSISNSDKDISYYRDMAMQIGSAHGVADSVSTLYGNAVKAGHGAHFLPELIELLGQK